MVDMFDDEITFALRRRIQAQALYHRVGEPVAGHVIMRFRKAGTWDGDLEQTVPPSLGPVLTQANHPLRMQLPDGPLVAVVEDKTRGIIEVSEHLLSHDVTFRRAAIQHFLAAQRAEECWVSPYVLDLLRANAELLESDEESTWISAGVLLHDAIERDFRVNCAGVRQASRLRFDESYQQYLNRTIWPRAQCFEHDRPAIVDPTEDAEQIQARIREWAAVDDLGRALNLYLAFCGHLPLANDLSAGALVAAWEKHHPGHNIWASLWQWVDLCSSVLAEYHAARAFLEHPRWIPLDQIERLLNVIRDVIGSSEASASCERAPLWHLRALLLQHYEVHLEASAPGLNSEVLATSACWMTELVARLFGANPGHVKKGCEFLQAEVLPTSLRRWSLARSRMDAFPLRVSNLYAPFVWSDSLLAVAVRQFDKLSDFEGRDEYRSFLIRQLTGAISVGSLRLTRRRQAAYAFEEPVVSSELELPVIPTDDKTTEAAWQVLSAKLVIESEGSLTQVLSDLRDTPEGVSEFLCSSLRMWAVDRNEADQVLREMLNDNEWRGAVFRRLPLESLDKLISFLIDWQMQQQDEEWFVRLPQILAFECESANDPERRKLLLFGTTVSAMASDIASPVVRLLVGPKRTEIAALFDQWCQTTRLIARRSEPWLAARVRGFLGTVEYAI